MVLLSLTSEGKKPEDFTVYYGNPIALECDYEIALVSLSFWNSWHNISHKFKNNVINYMENGQGKQIILPDGNYTIKDFNNVLREHFKTDKPPIFLKVNQATARVRILVDKTVKLIFEDNDIHELLGFNKGIYENDSSEDFKIYEAQNLANINRNVDSILIHCSIVSSSYMNSIASDVIYRFNPTARPGAQIIERPFIPFYIPLDVKDNIREIRMRITDQLDRPIDLNGEHVNYQFHLRCMK